MQRQAAIDGVPRQWIEAALRSPVYRMMKEWRVAFPLHPQYRTPAFATLAPLSRLGRDEWGMTPPVRRIERPGAAG